jgi:hypothetical protein
VYWRHDIYLAGVAVRARDAIELIWRLRSYGFNDTAERIERALTIRTLQAELRDSDRDAVLYALVDRRRGGGLGAAGLCGGGGQGDALIIRVPSA